jgi:hypothetical protein
MGCRWAGGLEPRVLHTSGAPALRTHLLNNTVPASAMSLLAPPPDHAPTGPAPPPAQTAAALFAQHTISKYAEVKSLHVVLLCVTLGLVAGYALLLFRPLVRQVRLDAGRVAGLLSHVPPEVDVEAAVRGVVRGKGAGAAGEDGDGDGDDE